MHVKNLWKIYSLFDLL